MMPPPAVIGSPPPLGGGLPASHSRLGGEAEGSWVAPEAVGAVPPSTQPAERDALHQHRRPPPRG